MADFVLKKAKAFNFVLEDNPDKTYSLPAMSGLEFEDADAMRRIADEKSIVKQGQAVKAFICKYCPELKSSGLSDMEYFAIYNAYALAEGRAMGESSASQNS